MDIPHIGGQPPFKIINGEKWAYLKRGAGRPILVREKQYDLFKAIEKKARVNFHHLYLHGQIVGLNSNINPVHGLMSKFSVFKRKLTLEGGELHFEVRGGEVLLTDIIIQPNYRTRKMKDKSGLYKVTSDGEFWKPKKAPIDRIETSHAVVNGLAKDVETAAKFMPDFINHGYASEQMLEEKANSTYSLFYNPYTGFADADWRCIQDSTGLRGGSHAARRLAAAMKLAVQENRAVNWTVHERGVAIFKQALRQLSQEGARLTEQRVFYANPVVNLEWVDKLRRQTGMQLAPTPPLIDDTSIHQSVVSGNMVSGLAVSWNQLREQGEAGGNKTRAAVVLRAGERLAMYGSVLAVSSFGLPAWYAVVPWASHLLQAATSNLAPRYANQRVTTSPLDNVNYLVKSLKRG